jgi:hypothetical protein
MDERGRELAVEDLLIKEQNSETLRTHINAVA